MLVTIGKWSVEVGHIEGSTSHLVIRLVRPVEQNTLSGLEYFLVTMCCKVGIPFGSAMVRSYVAKRPMSPSAALVAC